VHRRAPVKVFRSSFSSKFKSQVHSSQDTAKAIEAAAEAFKGWSRTSIEDRKVYLQKILKEYTSRQRDVAANLQRELGAPKIFAEKVQSAMFNMHWATALAMAEPGAFQWTEDMGDTLLVKASNHL